MSLLSIGGVAAAHAIVHHIEDESLTSRSMAAKLLVKLGKTRFTRLFHIWEMPTKIFVKLQ